MELSECQKSQKNVDERNYAIDLIKIVAMIGVMALHSSMRYITQGEIHIADFVYDCGTIAIPLFFMVSGYLLIPRINTSYNYSLRKILKIIRFVAIITIGYTLLVSLLSGFDISRLATNFFGAFVQKGQFNNFWYFGAMILCYLLLPLISKLYHASTCNYIIIIITLIVVNTFVFSQSLSNSYWGGANC